MGCLCRAADGRGLQNKSVDHLSCLIEPLDPDVAVGRSRLRIEPVDEVMAEFVSQCHEGRRPSETDCTVLSQPASTLELEPRHEVRVATGDPHSPREFRRPCERRTTSVETQVGDWHINIGTYSCDRREGIGFGHDETIELLQPLKVG